MRLEFFAEVVATGRLSTPEEALALHGQHGLRDEVIARRFDWGREHFLLALVLRVWRLARSVERPVLPAYAGCKSWIELAEEVATAEATPVLDEEAFRAKLAAIGRLIPGLRAAAS